MLLDANKPTDAPVPTDSKCRPAGVLVDLGTGKRIPFPRKVDMATGDVEYLVPAANGVDVLVDPYTRAPYVRKYKAVGKLELVPMGRADKLGIKPPQKVESPILPMTKEEKVAGLEQYRSLYFKVWNEIRGDSSRVVDTRWEDYLKTNTFLDDFVLKRRFVSVGQGVPLPQKPTILVSGGPQS